MGGVIIAITALVIGIACPLATGEYLEPNCGVPNKESLPSFRIIGGGDAIINSNPWMAFIHSSTKLICGGTLITQRGYNWLDVFLKVYNNRFPRQVSS